MPSLQESVEGLNGWETIEDNHISHFFIGKLPLASNEVNLSPLAQYDDEFLDLSLLRGTAGKYELLKYLLNIDAKGSVIDMENGRPYANSRLEYKKIKAFRLEPLGANRGVYSIDGEVFCLEKIKLLNQIFFFLFTHFFIIAL